jgi:hypothetical protein
MVHGEVHGPLLCCAGLRAGPRHAHDRALCRLGASCGSHLAAAVVPKYCHTNARPDPKDALKRNIKDMSTNARFSVFRAKKKILRKTDL